MNKFNAAVEIILAHEGGYVNHPSDPGGETNFGISKRAYPKVDIKNLTRDQAKAIYKRDFWDKLKCEEFAFGVGLSLFDFGVNAGLSTASKTLQRACGAPADGVIGPGTIYKATSMNKNDLVEKFAAERILYYSRLATFKTFGAGWVRRTIETLSTALLMRDTAD